MMETDTSLYKTTQHPLRHPRISGPITDTGLPPATLLNRLRYAKTVAATGVGIAVLGPTASVHHTLKPVPVSFTQWARRWATSILWTSGIDIDTHIASPLDPDQPYVFVANHQAALDILVLIKAIPRPFGFVAKQELARVPILGLVLKHSPCLFIDRSDPRASLRSLHEAGERIRRGTSVLLFSEGSRSRGRKMLPFKRGAFTLALEAGVPVVPVVILDSYMRLDDENKAVRPGTVHVVIDHPMDISNLKRKESARLMADVEARMESILDQHHRP